MAGDPYKILGVPKSASAEAIRDAFRGLAKKFHPDRNPGNAAAERHFKDITLAYDLLRDPDRRGRFDRGDIDADGNPRASGGGGWTDDTPFTGGWTAGHGPGAQAEAADFSDLFSELFAQDRADDPLFGATAPYAEFDDLYDEDGYTGTGFGAGAPRRGQDLSITLEVDLEDVAVGGQRNILLEDGSALDLDIPRGARDGQQIRLTGGGYPGEDDGPNGDAVIEIRVKAHPLYRRAGDDLHIQVPVSVPEAILGGKVEVQTLTGPVLMAVPKYASNGKKLRVRGRGLPNQRTGQPGDLIVTITVVMPWEQDDELEALVRGWAESHPYDARKGWDGS